MKGLPDQVAVPLPAGGRVVLLLLAEVVLVAELVVEIGALEVTRVLLLDEVEVRAVVDDVAAAPGKHWK